MLKYFQILKLFLTLYYFHALQYGKKGTYWGEDGFGKLQNSVLKVCPELKGMSLIHKLTAQNEHEDKVWLTP